MHINSLNAYGAHQTLDSRNTYFKIRAENYSSYESDKNRFISVD